MAMTDHFIMKKQTVQIWHCYLPDLFSKETELFSLLSPDEIERANRFKFEIHRQRFIVARATLRQLLFKYIGIPAKDILFSYGEHGKPFIENHPIYFNVSHSHDRAIFAFTLDQEIGIDIEKVENTFKESVAKRFFSEQEFSDLKKMADPIQNFYQIWAKKEAVIKLFGKGLFMPLENFSVSTRKQDEKIQIESSEIYIKTIDVGEGYKAALATFSNINFQHFEHF